ncbi:MAG: RNA-binding protein [Phycisphaerales bacterium]
MTRLYVGNIRYSADEASLRPIFEAFGPVQEVYIGIDRETGRSRGFAFVTMADQKGATAAIAGLNGKEIDGRVLVVNEAQPRGPRSGPGGPGGPGPGGGGGGGGGGYGGQRSYSPRGSGPSFRQAPYSGPPPEGRPPKGGKPGRDRERGKERERERFDRENDW